LSLAGLQARERLRYLREHLERQQLTVYARDKSPVVTGEEIVQFDGKTWRVAEFSSDPASGEIGLTLIQHADAGTTDLSIDTVRDTGGGSTAGGGGTAPAVGGGGGGGTGIEVIQLDASGGAVTETLPSPSEGASVVVVRIDSSTKTAEIESPNSNDIIWTGRQNESKFEVYPQQSILLVADGSNWYVENAPVYSVSSRFRGIPKQGDLVFSRIMRHEFRAQSVILKVDEPPSQQVDFDVLSGGTAQATLQLPNGSSRLSPTLGGFRVDKGTSLQVECRTDTTDVRNAEVSFDLIRA
jgi:hypothetical protein